MKGKQAAGQSAASLAVFVLLGLFALMAVMTVLLCTQLYRRTIQDVGINSEKRIVESYLTDAVRTADRRGGVQVQQVDGLDVLCLSDALDEAWYRCIYAWDGMLLEQLSDDPSQLDVTMGEAICPLQHLTVQKTGKLIRMEATDGNGETFPLMAALLCDEGRGAW